MKIFTFVPMVAFATLAIAAPTTVVARADTCGQWDSIATGSYTVYNNLWGESSATSGSQCFGVDSLRGDTVSWHTTWTWEGGQNSVKSYPNAVVSLASKPLSEISSMRSTWSWTYTGSNIVADVSYDMFTAGSAGGSNEFEIMIWLAALGGAGPISSTYGSDGSATPVASTTIAGIKWNLYKGPNGSTTVYSFVAVKQVSHFRGNLKAFFKYLEREQQFPASQYLVSVGAGTEPFTGSNAHFTVSSYSISIR